MRYHAHILIYTGYIAAELQHAAQPQDSPNTAVCLLAPPGKSHFYSFASPPPRQVLKNLRSLKEEEGGFNPSAPWDLVISALLFNVGFLELAVLGRYESAAEVLQEAHAIRKTVVGEVHTLTVQAVVSRGWALTLTGKTLLAVEELTR